MHYLFFYLIPRKTFSIFFSELPDRVWRKLIARNKHKLQASVNSWTSIYSAALKLKCCLRYHHHIILAILSKTYILQLDWPADIHANLGGPDTKVDAIFSNNELHECGFRNFICSALLHLAHQSQVLYLLGVFSIHFLIQTYPAQRN